MGYSTKDGIHVFYPVLKQVSEQGSQRNVNVYPVREQVFQRCLCFYSVEKRFYSVKNLVDKPVAKRIKHVNSVLI